MKLIALVLLAVAACTPSPSPAPMPPDATDAAPTLDGATSPCAAACATMAALCGPQATDCATVFTHVDGARLIRTPSGAPLTCAAVAAATSKGDVAALGVSCP